jgi:SagB-type dehydrogenase family enzyme
MRRLALGALLLAACGDACARDDTVTLPRADRTGKVTLERALAGRRSVRAFQATALTRAEIGQLLWAAQGVTGKRYRTAPSAGALYPLELYVATARGVSRYEPASHRLRRVRDGDVRPAIHAAALNQAAVKSAPALFVVTAVYARTARKYGSQRSPRYVHMEAGHAAQNLLLQATALGLGAVPVGAFSDAGVREALGAPVEHAPLYVIPVGHPERE